MSAARRLLDRAVSALAAGQVVAIPTDTVYGLAVLPGVLGASSALFAAKGRPRHLELPVLVADEEQADQLAGPSGLPETARRLARAFWPGPLTLVVMRRPGLDWDLGGDVTTVGVRCPDHALARELCHRVGPLATTSANRHGEPPLATASAVRGEFGSAMVVVDGGRCDGMPSTVVDLTADPVRCLRAGSIDWESVVEVVSRLQLPPSAAPG